MSEAKPSPLTSWGTEPWSKRQVTSVPGATSIAGGRNLRSLASTVVRPLTGWPAAGGGGEPDWQAANVNASTSRSGRRGRGRVGTGAPWQDGRLLGAEGEHDEEHAAEDEDPG